jgi:hypothetical protein
LALRLDFLAPMFLTVRKLGGHGARSMKSMEARKWGQKDKHQLTAKGDLTGFIARLKSEAAGVAAVTKADERRPNFIAWSPRILLLDVKPVKDSMKHGCQQNACGRNENNAGENSITRGEHLGSVRIQGLNGSHTGEDHGGVQQRVDPAEASDEMVAESAKKEREPNHGTSKEERAQDTMIESSPEVWLNGARRRHS